MDVIQGFKETAVDKINMPTLAAFIPILSKKKADIEKIERKEFKYGQENRHYLDVYYPPATSAILTSNGKLAVIFFIYGGGYNTGSRRFPEPYDIGYRALASFFAALGFLTVIPDYGLVPEARFPAASEDIRDALVWVAGHAAEVAGAATDANSARTELDPGCVFMLAHSAGTVHTLVMHLYPPLRASLAHVSGLRIRGLVLNGTLWQESFVANGAVRIYFGGEAQQKERQPRGLWTALVGGEAEEAERVLRAFPEVMLIQAEREPEVIAEGKEVMEREMREGLERVGKGLEETYIAVGHNHISVNWALCTGDEKGERWGYDVVTWIKARLAS